ncbi:MAG: lasso peptide biosynthesis B2 protein [Gemmatimonadaceae bacterium]
MRRKIREYLNAVRKLRRISRREWRDLASAQFALFVAQVRLWTKEKGGLTTPAAQAQPKTLPSDASIARAKALALAVSRAASFGLFRPACLVRSMALCRLMERRGIHDAVVRLGVVKRGGRFHAHAWVEYGGIVLGDDPVSVSDYETLVGVSVLHAD